MRPYPQGMRYRLLLAAVLSLGLFPVAGAEELQKPKEPIGPPLVIGTWTAKHPNWSGVVEFFPNGRIAQGDRESGSWALGSNDKEVFLRLEWNDWQPEVVSMVSPTRFRGRVKNGQMTLIRAGELSRGEAPERKPIVKAPDFFNPELKELVTGATWILKDGKTFTFHPDGTTTASWHVHKGFWHVIGKYEVEMTISWRPTKPDRVTVGMNGDTLRWSDQDFGGIAKRVRRPDPPSDDR